MSLRIPNLAISATMSWSRAIGSKSEYGSSVSDACQRETETATHGGGESIDHFEGEEGEIAGYETDANFDCWPVGEEEGRALKEVGGARSYGGVD